ncbi:MAG: J domain-containing protein [Cyanobacteria bacterium P01_H01_bin.121]
MTPAATYYARLGLARTATPTEIRSAYRDLSKQYHPDTTNLPSSQAREQFQLICEAYRILNDPQLRQQYDRYLVMLETVTARTNSASVSPERQKVSYTSPAYLDPNDRPLSAGEVFALFTLVLTFLGCVMLAIVLGIMRGELITAPPG